MKNLSFFIAGHAEYGRLEALRDFFLLNKVKYLIVLYLDLAFTKKKFSRIEIYRNGNIKKKINIYNYTFDNKSKYGYIRIILTYFTYFFSIFRILRLIRNKKINFYIGIGTIITLITKIIFFFSSRKDSKLIFYCIDYFNRFYYLEDFLKIKYFINYFEFKIQFYLLKTSDFIWEISKMISIARNKSPDFSENETKKLINQIKKKTYVIPLGYSTVMHKNIKKLNLKKIRGDVLNIVFIGVINPNQGLDTLADAIKINFKFFMKKIHIHIIGDGPYLSNFKNNLIKNNLQSFFSIYGRLDFNKVSKIIFASDYGYAIFPNFKGNHSLNGEPGKIKMYYIYNLPCIVSHNVYLSKLIKKYDAGLVLRKNTLKEISSNLIRLVKYKSYYNDKFKNNVLNFKNNECISDVHFNNFFNQVLN